MTEIKYHKKIKGKPSISESAIEKYLNTVSHYNKPVEYSDKEQTPQPDYSKMQGSHYWI